MPENREHTIEESSKNKKITEKLKKASKKIIVRTDSPHQPRHTVHRPDMPDTAGGSLGTGAMVGAATAAVSIFAAYWQGEQTFKQAIVAIWRAAVASGTRSASTTALANSTKHVLFRNGARHLAHSHAPVIIAATLIDASVHIYRDIKLCKKGGISKRKVLYNATLYLARSGTKTTSAVIGGTIGAGYAAGYETWVAIVYATLGATVAYIVVTKILDFLAAMWTLKIIKNTMNT